MRTFETLILVTLLLSLIARFIPRAGRSRWVSLLSSLTVLLTAIHLVAEGYRWQMVPAYGLTLLLFLSRLPISRGAVRFVSKATQHARVTITRLGLVLGLLLLLASVTLSTLFPVFRLPDPSGPYTIGTTYLHLVDRARSETFTLDPGDPRELLVQVWYPAEPNPDASPVAYLKDARAVGPLLVEHIGLGLLPPFLLNHLSLVQTHAYPEASVSNVESSYPVLIFSHGYLGFVNQNTALMEELASHGYFLFSISHTYYAALTVFPDGRIVPADSAVFTAYVQEEIHTSDFRRGLRLWTEDTFFVLDELEKLNAGDPDTVFAGRLDLTRIGVLGMSFGGTTAISVCSDDDRCKAGVNLDGALLPATRLKKPFMHMFNESRTGSLLTAMSTIDDAAYGIAVRNSSHSDFSDSLFYSPLFKATLSAQIDGRRMTEIINDYARAFFDKHLKGMAAPLLGGPSSDYPEVVFRSHAP